MLAVGCVVTITGGQTSSSTCNRALFQAKEVPLREDTRILPQGE